MNVNQESSIFVSVSSTAESRNRARSRLQSSGHNSSGADKFNEDDASSSETSTVSGNASPLRLDSGSAGGLLRANFSPTNRELEPEVTTVRIRGGKRHDIVVAAKRGKKEELPRWGMMLPYEAMRTIKKRISGKHKSIDAPELDKNVFQPLAGPLDNLIKQALMRFQQNPLFYTFLQIKEFAVRTAAVNPRSFATYRIIGKGSFGVVNVVVKQDTGAVYAIKALRKRRMVQFRAVESCLYEQQILAKLDSPFTNSLKYSFETSRNLYLVLDYCSGGTMEFHLRRNQEQFQTMLRDSELAMRTSSLRGRAELSHERGSGRKEERRPQIEYRQMSESDVRFYAVEIMLGITHLHSLGIIYRDLKLSNVLIGRDGHVQLCDFGLAQQLTPENPTSHDLCGTPRHWAPEVVMGIEYDTSVDWWTFGVVIFQLVHGRSPHCMCEKTKDWCPFESYDPKRKTKPSAEHLNVIIDFTPNNSLGMAYKSLVEELLTAEPSKRLGHTARATLELQGEKHRKQRLTEDKVRSRAASAVGEHPFFASVNFVEAAACRMKPPFVPEKTKIYADSQSRSAPSPRKSPIVVETPHFEAAVAANGRMKGLQDFELDQLSVLVQRAQEEKQQKNFDKLECKTSDGRRIITRTQYKREDDYLQKKFKGFRPYVADKNVQLEIIEDLERKQGIPAGNVAEYDSKKKCLIM